MKKSFGFALPAAIFLLVVLAALGAFILSISATQSRSAALDVMGNRAYQAANAGREWLRRSVKDNDACPAGTTWGASTSSFGFPADSLLADFKVSLECRASTSSENIDGTATKGYDLRVVACYPANAAEPVCPGQTGGEGYVERQVQAVVFN